MFRDPCCKYKHYLIVKTIHLISYNTSIFKVVYFNNLVIFVVCVLDSDYQLSSEVQSSSVKNSTEFKTSPLQNLTPLAEAYMARDREFAVQHVSFDATVAR